MEIPQQAISRVGTYWKTEWGVHFKIVAVKPSTVYGYQYQYVALVLNQCGSGTHTEAIRDATFDTHYGNGNYKQLPLLKGIIEIGE